MRPKKSQRLSGKGEIISDTNCAERTDHGFHQCGFGVEIGQSEVRTGETSYSSEKQNPGEKYNTMSNLLLSKFHLGKEERLEERNCLNK